MVQVTRIKGILLSKLFRLTARKIYFGDREKLLRDHKFFTIGHVLLENMSKFGLSSPAVYAETYYVMRIILPFEIWLLGIGTIRIRIGKNTGI